MPMRLSSIRVNLLCAPDSPRSAWHLGRPWNLRLDRGNGPPYSISAGRQTGLSVKVPEPSLVRVTS